MFLSRRDGEPRLLLIGSVEISDYLDILAVPDRLPAFIAELLDALAALPPQEFGALDLFNLQAASPTVRNPRGGNRPPGMGSRTRAAPGVPGDRPAGFMGGIPFHAR